MNILLLNTNPVVSRLISLCVRDEDTVCEEISNVDAAALGKYDIVFVDDASYIDGLEDTLKNFMFRKKVFLSGKDFHKENMEYFDEVIQKPFLPSQITTVLEDLGEGENNTEELTGDHFIFPLSTEQHSDDAIEKAEEKEPESEKSEKAKVLDGNEIDRIKALLEDDDMQSEAPEAEDDIDYEARKVEVITEHLEADGLEIVREDEYVDILSKKAEKVKKKKKKKSGVKKKEETFTFEEALIAAVEGMKVKKIKKLLKGADVTIKISFRDEK